MGGLNQSIIMNEGSPGGPETLQKSAAIQGIGPLAGASKCAIREMVAFCTLFVTLLPFVDATGVRQGFSTLALVTLGAE